MTSFRVNDFYCSFRIDIWDSDMAKFTDTKLWLVGVAVLDFVPKRSQVSASFLYVDSAVGPSDSRRV